jgi:hypothetical protein
MNFSDGQGQTQGSANVAVPVSAVGVAARDEKS